MAVGVGTPVRSHIVRRPYPAVRVHPQPSAVGRKLIVEETCFGAEWLCHSLKLRGNWRALARRASLLRISLNQRQEDGCGQDETILGFHIRPFGDGLCVFMRPLKTNREELATGLPEQLDRKSVV